MGKSKNTKKKYKANNPTGIPSLKEIEMEECYLLFDAGSIDSIIEKLQSPSAEERECAAVVIANLVNSKAFIEALIKKKAFRIAGPLLFDKNLSVRHNIAGCLRNVAAVGGYQVCEAMVNQDIMTSVMVLLAHYKQPWVPEPFKENTIDSKAAIFQEACNLLRTLCENNDNAVTIFNKSNTIKILLPCLNTEVYKLDIPIAVANCLHTVSENNSHLSTVLVESQIDEQLKALMDLPLTCSQHILLATLAAGIKLNIYSGKLKECMKDVVPPIVKVIFSVLKELILDVLIKINEQLKVEPNDEKEVNEKVSEVDKILDDLDNLIMSKQMALQMLGNIFDDDPDEAYEEISSSESEMESSTSCMEIDETDVLPEEIGLRMTAELYNALVAENLLERVSEQIISPSQEILQSLMSNPNLKHSKAKAKEFLKGIDKLRCTALLCLSNIIQKGNVEDLGGPAKITELWGFLGNLLFQETGPNDVDQVEAVTGTMGAVLRILAKAKCTSQFNSMTELDLESICNFCSKSDDPRIKVHIIQILCSLGCILGELNTPNSFCLVKITGSVLLEICAKSESLWVAAEAIDALMDMFAEDHLDHIVKEIHLIEKLSHIAPIFKSKVKKQKKSEKQNNPVIQTAKDNLSRFIDYKKSVIT